MNHDKFNRKYHKWTRTHLTTCHYNPQLVAEKGEEFLLDDEIPKDFYQAVNPNRKLSYEGIEYGHEGFTAVPGSFSVDNENYYGKPCKVLDSSEEAQTFDVIYFIGESMGSRDSSTRTLVRLKDMPADHLQFHIRPFQSDMMRAGAFRHEIAFPEESFPPLWEDLE